MKSLFKIVTAIGICLISNSSVFAGDTRSTAEINFERNLGGSLYRDPNLSLMRNQSCAGCHSTRRLNGGANAPAFIDIVSLNNGRPVSGGSIAGEFGGLNAPSAGYAAFSPFFHWDADKGEYVGGQFWNGRANTLKEQAGGPPLNPVEMAMPSKWAVVTRLQENDSYKEAFLTLYNIDLDEIEAFELAPADETPPPGVIAAYDAMTQAISAFEKTTLFNKFNSKFDFVLVGTETFTEQEERGYSLFTGKARCSECHVTEITTAPNGRPFPPLLTDYTYDNHGLPRNVNIPNDPEPDLGLGGRVDIAAKDRTGKEIGKHKVMSLRNIAVTQPYMHNGVFTTLEQVVHFYNTRDVLSEVCVDNNDPGFGTTCWPEWELQDVANENLINREQMGDLQLTAQEEADIVAFLQTLTDNGFNTRSPFRPLAFPPMP